MVRLETNKGSIEVRFSSIWKAYVLAWLLNTAIVSVIIAGVIIFLAVLGAIVGV